MCVCSYLPASPTHCVAGEWSKHPPSELFKKHAPEAWAGTLINTREWINAHPRRAGKRKRSPPPAPVRVAPPVVEVETPPAADAAPLPELGDMLTDCDRIQRALTRLVRDIQRYKDYIAE